MEREPPPEYKQVVKVAMDRLAPHLINVVFEHARTIEAQKDQLRTEHPHWFIDQDKKDPRTKKEKWLFRRNKQKRLSREKKIYHALYDAKKERRQQFEQTLNERIEDALAVEELMGPEQEAVYLQKIFERE